MEETETTDMAEEHVRSRMPEEVVESLIMSMAVNMEWPPLADAAEEEEDDDDDDEVPLEEPLHVAEVTKELLRRLDERQAALEKKLAALMERIYLDLLETQARVHTELCAKGYVEFDSTTTRD
jgi:hypothetical protein